MLRTTVRVLAVALGSTAWAQMTQRASVDSTGVQGNDECANYPALSGEARFVAFRSEATNLVPGDTNLWPDIFVRDRELGTIERVNLGPGGAQANFDSGRPSISSQGRWVAFDSSATNLVPGDADFYYDVFVRDRLSGTTERISVDSSEVKGNDASTLPSISADGRYVAFASAATNLVAGDINAEYDIFVRDRQTGTTECVSLNSDELQGNAESYYPSISADGRYVAFASSATNLAPGDTNALPDTFVRDRQTGTTERVSVSSSGVQGDSSSSYYHVAISADGRFVAFDSFSTNLVPADTNGSWDVFLRDRQAGTTERASVGSGGTQANDHSNYSSLSADGRYVAFECRATNLVPGDTHGFYDIFVRDRLADTTERVSVHSSGVQGMDHSHYPSISIYGREVAFVSYAPNLVPGDTNDLADIFVRDLDYDAFVSFCDPGAGGVIFCPCFNTPSGPGRGCDNSSATGGASLSAYGGAVLSSDSLVFTTSGEKPTALSIVLQGTTSLPTGAVYGQGVRCVGGQLKRLYTKPASGGSITAPDFGAGDPTVHARSSALGDPIPASGTRFYMVYYRDPVVLGGCPSMNTFNTTQSGQVTWSP